MSKEKLLEALDRLAEGNGEPGDYFLLEEFINQTAVSEKVTALLLTLKGDG